MTESNRSNEQNRDRVEEKQLDRFGSERLALAQLARWVSSDWGSFILNVSGIFGSN